MTRCLEDKSLLMLHEGEGTDKQWFHLETCETCAERYKGMMRDLDLMRCALQQDPPPARSYSFPRLLSYRWIPVAVALLLAIASVWGGSRVWRADSPVISEQTFNSNLSQFLDEVSDAIVTGTAIPTADVASPDSDFSFLQVALGESCSDECQELYSNTVDEMISYVSQQGLGETVEVRTQKEVK